MRVLGKDLNEKVTVTHGRQLGFAGMMSVLSGMLLARNDWHWSIEFFGILLVFVGIIFIGVSLVHASQSSNGKPTSDTQTLDGN